MPPADQILNGLREIANNWKVISILWHFYLGVFLIILALGLRPSTRLAGSLLVLPLLSVSIFAWLTPNPVNGMVFALVGVGLLLIAFRMSHDRVRIASRRFMIPGAILAAFGWIYPELLDTPSFVPYLYSAPTGVIPCATLIILIGFALILDGLDSRGFCTLLGVIGLLYGVMGVAYLRITSDGMLIISAISILIFAIAIKKRNPASGKVVVGAQ